MRIIDDVKLDYNDVLIVPKRGTVPSRSLVNLNVQYNFVNGDLFRGVPIIAANMDGVGTFEMAKSLEEFECSVALSKHYTEQELVEYFNGWQKQRPIYSLGISESDVAKFAKVYEQTQPGRRIGPMMVCIDVANGYTDTFLKFIEDFKRKFSRTTIIAGNVVTPEMTETLIMAGVSIVKVGIGPGSVCTTRKMTGVGYPQLSAVIECADAAHGLKGHIIADGGCSTPGDVAKAFGAGADFVMLGGMLAGHTEGGGEIILKENKTYRRFYGMSSDTAMKTHNGGVAEYRASEGKTVEIPYRGPVENTMKEILGGLRSACTYVGAKELKELTKRTTFVRVNNQLNNSLSAYNV